MRLSSKRKLPSLTKMENEFQSTIHCTITNFIPLTLPSHILTASGKLQSGIQHTEMMLMLPTISCCSCHTFLQYDSCMEYTLMTSSSELKAAQNSTMSKTFQMLTKVDTWQAFSNHTVGDGGSTSNSLEAIHNGIHVIVRRGGHMSNSAVSGEYTHTQYPSSFLIFIIRVQSYLLLASYQC